MPRLVRTRLVLAVRDLDVSTRYWIGMLGCSRDFGDGSDGWSFLSRGEFSVMLGSVPMNGRLPSSGTTRTWRT